MESDPTAKLDAAQETLPSPSRVPEQRRILLLMKVTVPVGTRPVLLVTIAVRVTDWRANEVALLAVSVVKVGVC
jgi:hypothetical protein